MNHKDLEKKNVEAQALEAADLIRRYGRGTQCQCCKRYQCIVIMGITREPRGGDEAKSSVTGFPPFDVTGWAVHPEDRDWIEVNRPRTTGRVSFCHDCWFSMDTGVIGGYL